VALAAPGRVPYAMLLRRSVAAAIDRYLLLAGPTAANPPLAAGQTDGIRRTDGHRTVT